MVKRDLSPQKGIDRAPRRRGLVEVGAAVTAAAALLSACSPAGGEAGRATPPTTSSAEQTPGASATPTAGEISPDRPELTASERAFLDSVAPEKLATMTDEQITAAFRIPASEATTPEAYARAYNLRTEAMFNSSTTKTTLPVDEGLVKLKASALRIASAASTGFQGKPVADEAFEVSIAVRSDIVASVKQRVPNEQLSDYWLKNDLLPGTIKSSGDMKSPSGMNIEFKAHSIDNLNLQVLRKHASEAINMVVLDQKAVYRLSGVTVNPNGFVLPKSMTVENVF